MKTIKYQIEKKTITLEVEDDFAKSYSELEVEFQRQEWRQERAAKRHNSSFDELEEAGFQIADDEPSLDEQLYSKEIHEALHKAIKKLTPEQQRLVALVFYQDKSQSEIAKEMGIDKSSLSHRMIRIYKQLKKFLEKFDN